MEQVEVFEFRLRVEITRRPPIPVIPAIAFVGVAMAHHFSFLFDFRTKVQPTEETIALVASEVCNYLAMLYPNSGININIYNGEQWLVSLKGENNALGNLTDSN